MFNGIMRTKSRFYLLLLFFIILPSCNTKNNQDSPTSAPMDRVLQVRMHDFAINNQQVQKIVIEIKEIQAHHSEKGWQTVSTESQKFDLLELQNGVSAIILQKPLDIGTYDQIRLVLNQTNEIFVNNLPYHLKIPSGEETGVKLISPFEIKKGKMVEVTLDFDAEKSVNLTKGVGFILKPVIKIEKIAEFDGAGIVPPTGGNVSTLDGSANVQIPYGALNASIIVSIDEADISSFPQPVAPRLTQVGKAYNFEPSGYIFNKDILLTLKYDEAEVKRKGLEQNLKLFRYDESQTKWLEIPIIISVYSNAVYAWINHFSVYALYAAGTCSDGVQNGPEGGIDCGGDCPAVCVNCNGYDYGEGMSSELYSFGDPAVVAAAQEALNEYGITMQDTPDEKMKAVAYYVHRNMTWMLEEGWFWLGPQSAAKTIALSGSRYGSPNEEGTEKDYCTNLSTYAGTTPKYCGDCEDFAILRASLLRHLGVAQQCVMNVDYHAELDHSNSSGLFPWELPPEQQLQIIDPHGASGPSSPYDYETASNLFESSNGKKGGHTFNVVIYQNKFRIMDYSYLIRDWYAFTEATDWDRDMHLPDNVWNDHIGNYWFVPFIGLLPPPLVIHNYPGPNKCYEPGKNYWTHRTLYADYCP